MSTHRPVSARRGNRGGILHNVDNWHYDEPTAGTPMSEERLVGYCLAHNYSHLIAAQSFVRTGRPINNPFEIVVPEEATRGGEHWIDVHTTDINRQDERGASPVRTELTEALQELQEVTADAKEDGLKVPSEVAFANAERLLKAMYHISPRRYGVYPEPDGYIAIDARGANGRIAVVMCGSDGGVLCLVTIDDEPRRARYYTARKLPDGFIREALHDLGEEPVL